MLPILQPHQLCTNSPPGTDVRASYTVVLHPLPPRCPNLPRELMLRTDGVGIRSALAAKRLNDLGMPGVAVPAELQVRLSACVEVHKWMPHGCAEASGPGRAA